MPSHDAPLKSMRQTKKRKTRNSSIKSFVKTAQKKVLASIDAEAVEEAKTNLKQAVKAFDKACSKGVIHKNKCSRKISRLTLKVNAMA